MILIFFSNYTFSPQVAYRTALDMSEKEDMYDEKCASYQALKACMEIKKYSHIRIPYH